jgi:hypothetical protein
MADPLARQTRALFALAAVAALVLVAAGGAQPDHHISVQAPPSATMLQYVVMIDATTPGIGQLYTDNAARRPQPSAPPR